jgi:peptide/nickel transport system substrate-binding protein
VPLLVGAVVALAACGGGGGGGQGNSGGSAHGGQLTVAYNIEPDTLDPAQQTTTAVTSMVSMVVEELVKYDKNGKLVPDLATSWQQSGDGLTYTFTLRQNVKFTDGTPFNADAVKWSLDRLNSPATFKAQPGQLKVIKDVTAVDPTHVKITLKTPFSPFLAAMTQPTAGVMSPQEIGKQGNTIATIVHPIGTGPYMLAEYVHGDHVLFKRNPDYWGQKPAYASQLYKIVPEAANRESLVKAGQADVAFAPPPNDLAALRNDGDLSVMMLPSDRTIFVSIDTQDTKVPQLQNRQVRQAMNYAVNKDAIIKNVTYGTTTKLDAPIAKGVFGYCKTGSYDYNPTKAKQLLQQAGATNLTLTMRSPQGRYIADYEAAQAIAGDLRKVGINVNLANPPDWASYVGMVNVPPAKATQDIHILGWAPAFLDASQQMQQFTTEFIPPGGLSTSYYSNPQVDQLVAKANSESDKAQRQKDYCSAEKTIWNDAPWIFLWNQKNPTVTTKKVTGVYGLPNEWVVTTWAQPSST